MSMTAIIIMIVAAIGMVFGLAKQKSGEAWGRPLAIACIVVALVCAFWNIINQTFMGGGNMTGEKAYQRISAEYLAQHLAEAHPGAKAIIVLEPSMGGTGDGQTKPLLEGLRRGLQGKIEIVAEVAPQVPANMKGAMGEMPMAEGSGMEGEMMPPLEMWFKSALMIELLAPYKGQYDMVITTIGLPQDAQNLPFWKDKTPVVIASGSIYELRKPIQSGMIVAAVTYNPKAVYDENDPPRDLKAAFDKRYLLVTPENVATVASGNPDLFKGN